MQAGGSRALGEVLIIASPMLLVGSGLSVLGGTRPKSAAEAALTLQPLPPPNRTVALQASEMHPLPITVSAPRDDLPCVRPQSDGCERTRCYVVTGRHHGRQSQ